MSREIELKLPENYVQAIVARLAKFPYEEVFMILKSIEEQTVPQLNGGKPAVPPTGGSISRPTSGRLAERDTSRPL